MAKNSRPEWPQYTLVLLLVLVGLSCACGLLHAQGPISGFMPKAGQLDIAFTYSQETFSTFYDAQGASESRSLSATSYSGFLEYGATENTALVLTLPYIKHDEANAGLQDASLWLKYRNYRQEHALGSDHLLTAIGLSTPLSRYANDNPQAIGRRATTFHGRLAWQYQANYGWFVHLQSGFDFQLAPEALAALPVLLRGGFGNRYFYGEWWLERYQSLNNNSADGQLAAGTASSWTRTGGTLFAPLWRGVGLFTGGAFILGGRNIGRSRRWNVGVVFRFD